MDLLSALLAPLQFDLTRRALLEVTLVGLACGTVGVLVVLRGLSFIGDALAHCVVPGVVFGYLTRTSLELWGGLAGVLSAWIIGFAVRAGWLGGDAATAVVYTGMFALGLALISGTGSYLNDLTEILFGNVLAVNELDLVISAVTALIVLAAVALLYRPLVLASFDPTAVRALGLPLLVLDLALYALIALAVVSGVAAVGSVLVTALLIVPAATARLLVRTVSSQMLLSALLGSLAGWVGLYVSYYQRVASGGAIVLAAVLFFMLALILSPRSGLPSLLARRQLRSEQAKPVAAP
jgi:manganese/iron transport system permease protein